MAMSEYTISRTATLLPHGLSQSRAVAGVDDVVHCARHEVTRAALPR